MSDRGEAVYALLRHVRPLVLGSARLVEATVRPLGWTVGSRAVVEVLHATGPATVPHVAESLSLARQNVQRQVDELVRLGHARTVPNPAHRRSVLVELTPEGRQAFTDLHERELMTLSGMVTACDDADLAVAREVLAALERDIRVLAATANGAGS